MDIKLLEPLYLLCNDTEYVIRSGTVGIEKNKVVFFHDVTRTNAVGFSRDFCMDNPETFRIIRTISDKEVSIRDVFKAIDESDLDNSQTEKLYQKIKQLV